MGKVSGRGIVRGKRYVVNEEILRCTPEVHIFNGEVCECTESGSYVKFVDPGMQQFNTRGNRIGTGWSFHTDRKIFTEV